MRDITQIVLHHSASPVEALTWDKIRAIHIHERGWLDIGYHAGVVNDDGAWKLVKGRDPDIPGAHVAGHNKHSLGICFEGNYSQTSLSREAFVLGATQVLLWMQEYGVGWVDVVPHRELAPTECPGKQFPYHELVGWLRDRT